MRTGSRTAGHRRAKGGRDHHEFPRGVGFAELTGDPRLEELGRRWEAVVVWHNDAALKPVVKMDWLRIEQLIPVPVDPNWTVLSRVSRTDVIRVQAASYRRV
jgi:hypothetical protein